jgi:hypothetical protein
MDQAGVLADGFNRVAELVRAVLDDLDPDDLLFRPGDAGNPIGWLVWHLTRVQDDHVAAVAGHEQVWTAQGWAERFGLPYDAAAIGYGHSSEEVSQLNVSGQLLVEYHDAVHAETQAYVGSLSADELDTIVDTRWDPPVSLGTRLVSVISDDLQHVGQAAYVRGLLP